jgi:hypothetical protein
LIFFFFEKQTYFKKFYSIMFFFIALTTNRFAFTLSKYNRYGILSNTTSCLCEGNVIVKHLKLRKFFFVCFCLKGLLTDDTVKDSEITREALRRLPHDVYQERQFRMTRALAYSGNKSILPESEWITPEQVKN